MAVSANPPSASKPRNLERFIISLLKGSWLRRAVPSTDRLIGRDGAPVGGRNAGICRLAGGEEQVACLAAPAFQPRARLAAIDSASGIGRMDGTARLSFRHCIFTPDPTCA